VIKLFIRGLAPHTTEEELTALFSTYGRVRSLKLNKDIFTGKVRGTATVEMEGHEARAAIDGLDGKEFLGRPIYVALDVPMDRGRRRR
jgi:RNA recognition motif-containing protein